MANPRVSKNAADNNAAQLAQAIGMFQMAKMSQSSNTGYSDAGSPIYDVLFSFGGITKLINGIDDAFTSHKEVRDALKEGEAAITVSVFDGRDVYSLATREGSQVYYYGFIHDKDGDPRTTGALILTEVVLNKDFTVPGTEAAPVILKKGDHFFKALPVDYALKCKPAVPVLKAA